MKAEEREIYRLFSSVFGMGILTGLGFMVISAGLMPPYNTVAIGFGFMIGGVSLSYGFNVDRLIKKPGYL